MSDEFLGIDTVDWKRAFQITSALKWAECPPYWEISEEGTVVCCKKFGSNHCNAKSSQIAQKQYAVFSPMHNISDYCWIGICPTFRPCCSPAATWSVESHPAHVFYMEPGGYATSTGGALPRCGQWGRTTDNHRDGRVYGVLFDPTTCQLQLFHDHKPIDEVITVERGDYCFAVSFRSVSGQVQADWHPSERVDFDYNFNKR